MEAIVDRIIISFFPFLEGESAAHKSHPEYRLRVGDYTVLFEVEKETIVIYRIRHRREVYR